MLKISNLSGFGAGVVGTPIFDSLLLESGDFLLLEDGINKLGLETGAEDPQFNSVVLMLPLNGNDGDTISTDESNSSHSLTFLANAELDTAQKKFGTTSLVLDGSGDAVQSADSADWNFGASPFTIELWARFTQEVTSDGDSNTLISQWGNPETDSFILDYVQISGVDYLRFIGSSDGVSVDVDVKGTWTPDLNTWIHLAVDRSGSDDFRVYANGEVIQTVNSSITLFNGTAVLWVGGREDLNTLGHHGWIDEVRITKGIARYGGAFTPPDNPFPIK